MVNRAKAKKYGLRQALKQSCHTVIHQYLLTHGCVPGSDGCSSVLFCLARDPLWTFLFLPFLSVFSLNYLLCNYLLGTCPLKVAYSQAHQRTGSASPSMNNHQIYMWLLRKIPNESQLCDQFESETFSLLLWCCHYPLSTTFLSSVLRFYTKYGSKGRGRIFPLPSPVSPPPSSS